MISDRQAVELAVMATDHGHGMDLRTRKIVDALNRIFPDLHFLLDANTESKNATIAVIRDGATIGESEGPFEVLRVRRGQP